VIKSIIFNCPPLDICSSLPLSNILIMQVCWVLIIIGFFSNMTGYIYYNHLFFCLTIVGYIYFQMVAISVFSEMLFLGKTELFFLIYWIGVIYSWLSKYSCSFVILNCCIFTVYGKHDICYMMSFTWNGKWTWEI
jgi:hypothetical protein